MIAKGMGAAVLAGLLVALWAGIASAALPFITDDAGTLGRGTSQVELLYVGSTDKETDGDSTVKTDRNLPGATFSYGFAETLDLTLGFARSWGTETVDGISSNDSGNADYQRSPSAWRGDTSTATTGRPRNARRAGATTGFFRLSRRTRYLRI
ncbi:MAG: hypothetical protein H6Q81_2664 [Deltaproteobacteria bacterium]|nr:hypothetical protein [Deltaproteobacteria bacterium]